MKWAYGVTTVPDRLTTLLPRTLESLERAGFPDPRLFVDGCCEKDLPEPLRKYAATCRYPAVRTFGSWVLAAWELYARNPFADRYAFFQDDLVTYRNLRQYLEACPFPEKGYWNLYTFEMNVRPIRGWYESNQLGKGAVGLIFSSQGLRTLLSQRYMIERLQNITRGWKALDGGIVCAYREIGWKEYVHNPSLLQHTGETSTMGNRRHPTAKTFRGEDFDAMTLLDTSPREVERDPLTRRIGLVGPSCTSLLGERCWELSSNTDIQTWLVKPNGFLPTRHKHPDVDMIFCPLGSAEKLGAFLKAVDVVVFLEEPLYSDLIPMAHEQGKRIIALTEAKEIQAPWSQHVDLFLCLTPEAYNNLGKSHPCVEFSWPSKWNTGADNEFNLLCRTGEHRIAIV